MTRLIIILLAAIYIPLCFLYAWHEGRKKAKGCAWCGNKYNEADYCGLCGKNEAGEIRPGFTPRK